MTQKLLSDVGQRLFLANMSLREFELDKIGQLHYRREKGGKRLRLEAVSSFLPLFA
jgi:hypothetical protein